MKHFFIPNYWKCLNIKDAKGEIWKDIDRYEGKYMVSNYGRVKSIRRYCKTSFGQRVVKEKILRIQMHHNGYLAVSLSKNDINWKGLVHIIEAKSFNLNPFNKPTINHNDGDKTNNFFWNLGGATSKEQDEHARRTGLKISVVGDKCKYSKLKSFHIKEIVSSTMSVKELSKIYGVTEGRIYAIKRGYAKSDVTNIKYQRKFISVENVLYIFNSKMKPKDALKEFNITRSVYYQIKMGVTWSNITGKKYKKVS